jgi:hypothetical protein
LQEPAAAAEEEAQQQQQQPEKMEVREDLRAYINMVKVLVMI